MRFQIPESKKLIHETELTVQWQDVGALGYVDSTAFARFLEDVRLDWLQSIGAPPRSGQVGPVIASSFMSFLTPLRFGDRLKARLFSASPARTSFSTFTTVANVSAPHVTQGEGGAVIVWYDPLASRPCELPAWLRALLSR